MFYSIIDAILYIINSICFIGLPLWFALYVVGYILQIKKVPKTSLIMPLVLIFSNMGIMHFYLENNYVSDLNDLFVIAMIINFILIPSIYFIKFNGKYHLYNVPLLLIFVLIIGYLYI